MYEYALDEHMGKSAHTLALGHVIARRSLLTRLKQIRFTVPWSLFGTSPNDDLICFLTVGSKIWHALERRVDT